MPASPPAPLDAHLGYWLRFVSNHVSYAFKERVEAHGVTVAEWVILRALFDARSMKPSALSEQVGLTRGAVSKLVDRLASKELVRTRADSADRRSVGVQLTTSGRKLVPTLARLADENDAAFFACLSARERAAFRDTLQRLVEQHGLKALPVD